MEHAILTTAMWWVRGDLRLTDNQALTMALANAEQVIPVFVLDPVLLDSPYAGEKRVAFLFEGLHQLDADLRARGSRLVVRRGEPLVEMRALLDEIGAKGIFAEEYFFPYFRVFNPVLQGKTHDPDGAFVRRWLPELERVPGTYVHVPWEMPDEVQREAGCVIGQDYLAPIIDHAWARERERALVAYSRVRET